MIMGWWWLNVAQMSSSLVYLTQIDSLHLHRYEGGTMVISERNCRVKVSTDRAWDSWEGGRYPAHGWSLTTLICKSKISRSHYLSHNWYVNERCSSRSNIDLSPNSFTLGADNNRMQNHLQENTFALISNIHILPYSYQDSKTCKCTKLHILLIKFVIGKWNYMSQVRLLSLFL